MEDDVRLERQLADQAAEIVAWSFDAYHWRKDGELVEHLRAAIASSSGTVVVTREVAEAARQCVQQVFTNRRAASDAAVLHSLDDILAEHGREPRPRPA